MHLYGVDWLHETRCGQQERCVEASPCRWDDLTSVAVHRLRVQLSVEDAEFDVAHWLVAQRTELFDGSTAPLFPAVFAIFGHGNVLSMGAALHEYRSSIPVWRGHTEQGMALAAVGYAKATHRRQVGVATSSIGPGALNMVTAAGVANANRLPLLLLPGDTFVNRAPDPVLQQIEPFADATVSVNDAFRPVSRYFDRITRPEQLIATLPQVAVLVAQVAHLDSPADIPATASPWIEQLAEDHAVTTRRLFRA